MRRTVLWVVLFAPASTLVSCGRDEAETKVVSARGDATPSPLGGPLARWRRGSEPGPWGRPLVIEALRDCRVRMAYRLRDAGVPDRLENRRDVTLAAGDSVRISWRIESSKPAYLPAPPEVDRAAGRVHLLTHSFQTAIDDEPTTVRSDPVWSRDETPWVRIERTEPPPGALDFPEGEVALAAVGVADVDPATPEADRPRLDLAASPPRWVGGAPASPGAARHVSALVISIAPPPPPGE